MELFRLRLRLEGPLASPMASGMIFGQLCWVLRDLEGAAALEAWLGRPEALWGVSDAFMADHLPRPLLAPGAPARRSDEDRKVLRHRSLITREGFLRTRSALAAAKLDDRCLREPDDTLRRTARNSIDRHTRRALDDGGLFFRTEYWPREVERAAEESRLAAGFERDVYVEAPAEELPRVRRLFESLGEGGFGKAAGLGRGRFAVIDASADPELAALHGANRRLSLSRGVATPNMADLLCRLQPHFGKAGPRITVGEGASPFKRPLILTRAGASFTPKGEGRFGAWLRNVHPTRPEIGHNAFHVSIPFAEQADA